MEPLLLAWHRPMLSLALHLHLGVCFQHFHQILGMQELLGKWGREEQLTVGQGRAVAHLAELVLVPVGLQFETEFEGALAVVRVADVRDAEAAQLGPAVSAVPAVGLAAEPAAELVPVAAEGVVEAVVAEASAAECVLEGLEMPNDAARVDPPS